MALAVVAIHTRPLDHCMNKNILNIYDLIVGLAVPFFFLASGYFLAVKVKYLYGNKKDFSRIKLQLIKIVKMYILWTLIYCPLAIYHFIYSETSLMKSILLYIRGVFFIGEQYNSWPLWYLLSTIYTLIAIRLILQFKNSSTILVITSIVFSGISIGLTTLVNYEGDVPVCINLFQKLIKYSVANGRIFNGFIYIPVGMLLAYKKLPKLVSWGIFVLCFICNYFIDNLVISHYLLILTAIAFFGIVESIYLPDRKWYLVLRNMSTIIYLIHMYVWTIYYKIIYKRKTYGIDSFIVTALTASIIAIVYLQYKKFVKIRLGEYS